MKRIHSWLAMTFMSVVVVLAMMTGHGLGQTNSTQAEGLKRAGGAKSAEQVLSDLMKHRKERPVIAPTRKPIVEASPDGAPPTMKFDTRVLGTAPGIPQPKLRLEGEFVPLRRGRVVRTPVGNQAMFVFEADGKHALDPPMFIMPCQILESMERLVVDGGDSVVFFLSGQIFTYRGANYILPSVMKLAVDMGNLN